MPVHPPPFLYDGLDTPEDIKAFAPKSADALYGNADQPATPLRLLRAIAREAPLGSLLVAFLLGLAVGRRR